MGQERALCGGTFPGGDRSIRSEKNWIDCAKRTQAEGARATFEYIRGLVGQASAAVSAHGSAVSQSRGCPAALHGAESASVRSIWFGGLSETAVPSGHLIVVDVTHASVVWPYSSFFCFLRKHFLWRSLDAMWARADVTC